MKTKAGSSSFSSNNKQRDIVNEQMKTKRGYADGEKERNQPQQKQQQQQQQQEAEQVLSTRICIKNLPPLVTGGNNKKKKTNNAISTDSYAVATAELRRHLQHCFSLPQFNDIDMKMTDVKLLEKRRMAFIGFVNHQAATKSIEYLHQSYYKTSRLVMEFATSTTTKAKQQQQQEPKEASKEKDDKTKSTTMAVDRKKQEFLAVMGISNTSSGTASTTSETKAMSKKEQLKKTKTSSTPTRPFWANDDIMNAADVASTAAATTTEDDTKNSNNDDDDDDDNRAKTEMRVANKKKHDTSIFEHHDDDEDDNSSTSSSNNDDDDDEDNADPLKLTTTSSKTISSTNNNKNKAQSDLDFLKSKTVNVQDLVAAQTTDTHDDDENDNVDNDSRTTEDDEAVPMAVATKPETQISIRHDQRSTESSSSIEHDNGKTHNNDENNDDDDNEKDDDENDNDDNDNNNNNSKDPCRLFVRNLPFSTTRDELIQHFAGTSNDADAAGIIECHVPAQEHDHHHHHDNNDDNNDAHLYKCKGFAFVTFSNAHDAIQARYRLDGRDFQGRLLHILSARKAPLPKQQSAGDSQLVDLDKLTYKQRQEYLRRQQQENEQGGGTGWSASFVRGDAVVDNMASRLGLRKGDILNVKDASSSSSSGRGLSAGDAAVRLALGETAVIEENRLYFSKHGIDMEALVSLKKPNSSSSTGRSDTSAGFSRGKEKGGATSGGGGDDDGIIERSKTSILVKNLPHDTTQEDLLKLFGSTTAGSGAGAGAVDSQLSRILLPPSRTVAVVEYRNAKDAKSAFRRLAYRRFKNVPIYLEWAPLAAATATPTSTDTSAPTPTEGNDAAAAANNDNVDEDEIMDETGPTPTIYVKNLSFHTSEEDLHAVFSKHVNDVRAVRIPKKVAPMKRGGTTAASSADHVRFLSMGYGFVEFGSRESVQKVMKSLQGTNVAGHALQLSVSKGTTSSMTQSTLSSNKRNLSKLVVRNVPFQAARKELLQLFGSFGQLKKVRLPKKFDGNHRGFCFVEFVTRKDALAAVKALSRTHLYGRRLVIEWADEMDEDESELDGLREKAKRDMDHHHGHNDSRKNKKIRFE